MKIFNYLTIFHLFLIIILAHFSNYNYVSPFINYRIIINSAINTKVKEISRKIKAFYGISRFCFLSCNTSNNIILNFWGCWFKNRCFPLLRLSIELKCMLYFKEKNFDKGPTIYSFTQEMSPYTYYSY